MPIKNARKAKLHAANREFNDELLNVAKMQAKMEKFGLLMSKK